MSQLVFYLFNIGMKKLVYHLFNKNGSGFRTHVTFLMELYVIDHGFQTVTVVAKSYLIGGTEFKDPFLKKILLRFKLSHKWNVNSLHIITNNIKETQNKNKRLSIIEYFKNKIGKNGISFLQETHSTTNDEGKWKDEFSRPVFYSHDTSKSCGVLIKLFGKNKICVNSQITGKHRRILILGVTIDRSEYILVNTYNANTESEQ